MMAQGDSTITQSLKERWEKLNHDLPTAVVNDWWAKLSNSYSEESRYYHNLSHIKKIFNLYDQNEKYLSSPKAVSLAIYFSKLHYDPKSSGNEDLCVDLFKSFATDAGFDQDFELVNKVTDLILETKAHCTEEHMEIDKFGDQDIHFFLDFDMSILGSSAEEYREYIAQIKKEYDFLSSASYSILRCKVLKTFLQIPNIFGTKQFRELFEGQARANIQWEIQELENSQVKVDSTFL